MGCEDFVVRLSSDFSPQHVAKVLLANKNIRHDMAFSSLPGETHFCYEDTEHFIELELACAGRTKVSLRFAVCHPTSIDGVVAALVVELASTLRADTLIAEDLEPDDSGLGMSFGPSQLEELRDSIIQCIPKKRHLWQVEFGTNKARLSCREALEVFVIGSSLTLRNS
jgi:hypothetical protein